VTQPSASVDSGIGPDDAPFSTRAALLRLIRARPAAVAGALVVAAFLMAALFADLLAPYSAEEGNLDNRMAGPSPEHLLGTDKVGRDIFSRLMYGARQSVLLGVGAVLISQALAAVVGMTSGYFGGWLDLAVQRVIDMWVALPGLLFLIFVIGTIGGSTTAVLVVLGLLLFAGSSRVLRGVTLSLKGLPYVDAARGVGASHARVIFRHILPNVLPLIVVQATLQMGAAILIESSLSFLGFGVPPPSPTWGRMLADARSDLTSPGGFNLAVWPGLAITLVVFSFNMLGDGLHDALDRSRRHAR
jgi:peptide/nickel transport system permease protein